MRCQRHILGIHWSDYITNDTVLGRTGRRPFNDIIIQRRLEWLGHVIRMPADRLPRHSLSAEGNDMTDWSLQPGGQRITWRDIVDRDLKPFRRPGFKNRTRAGRMNNNRAGHQRRTRNLVEEYGEAADRKLWRAFIRDVMEHAGRPTPR